IRDDLVTGVQTCALPILQMLLACRGLLWGSGCLRRSGGGAARTTCGAHGALVAELLLALEIFVKAHGQVFDDDVLHAEAALELRSEERRVGKEGRCR